MKSYCDFCMMFTSLNPQLEDVKWGEDMSYSQESIDFLQDNLDLIINLVCYSYFIFKAELDRRKGIDENDTFYETIVRADEDSLH